MALTVCIFKHVGDGDGLLMKGSPQLGEELEQQHWKHGITAPNYTYAVRRMLDYL